MATRKTRKIKRKSGSKSKNSAVKKIQKAYKKKQTKKRNKAAIKLQKVIRGTISRKECAICQMPGASFKTNCNHFFHKKCLKKWCKKKGRDCPCPLCRKNLDQDELNNLSISLYSSSNNSLDSDEREPSPPSSFRMDMEEIKRNFFILQVKLNDIINLLTEPGEDINRSREDVIHLASTVYFQAEEALEYSERQEHILDQFGSQFTDRLEDIKNELDEMEDPLVITDSNTQGLIEKFRRINIEISELDNHVCDYDSD